jgi:precorrin-6B methylase 2
MRVDIAKRRLLARHVSQYCRQDDVFHDVGKISGVISVAVAQHMEKLSQIAGECG